MIACYVPGKDHDTAPRIGRFRRESGPAGHDGSKVTSTLRNRHLAAEVETRMQFLLRTFLLCIVGALAAVAVGAEPEAGRLKRHFKSDDFTVTWGTALKYDSNAELEIGDGNGHGGTLGWLRFQPRDGGVEVLSIDFDRGWQT